MTIITKKVRIVAALHLMAKRLASFRPPINTHNVGIAATAQFLGRQFAAAVPNRHSTAVC